MFVIDYGLVLTSGELGDQAAVEDDCGGQYEYGRVSPGMLLVVVPA
jgi:hypothetical protein